MGRWRATADGSLDFVASDHVGTKYWSIIRCYTHPEGEWDIEIEEFFVARLRDGEAGSNPHKVRYEAFETLPDAVARCMEWMKQ